MARPASAGPAHGTTIAAHSDAHSGSRNATCVPPSLEGGQATGCPSCIPPDRANKHYRLWPDEMGPARRASDGRGARCVLGLVGCEGRVVAEGARVERRVGATAGGRGQGRSRSGIGQATINPETSTDDTSSLSVNLSTPPFLNFSSFAKLGPPSNPIVSPPFTRSRRPNCGSPTRSQVGLQTHYPDLAPTPSAFTTSLLSSRKQPQQPKQSARRDYDSPKRDTWRPPRRAGGA